MPESTVIPELVYEDVGEASDWLCTAFDFTERVRIGSHRAQLSVGAGAVVLLEPSDEFQPPGKGELGHAIMVRVEDANRHHERARRHGARILHPPADYPYGERQYTAEDLAGHRWSFSESIADVAPEEWGGTSSPGRR